MHRALLLLGSLLLAVGCHRPAPQAKPERVTVAPAPTPTPEPAPEPPPPEPPKPATVERLSVPGDLAASVVRADRPPLTVFVGGMCSNANAYLQSFPQAAQKAGGVVGIEGDQPCGPGVDPAYRTYSWDALRLHARIEAALTAAGVPEIPKEGLTIVGYSQGASLAEQLAARYPDRYARVVIIAAPTDPAPRDFTRARALVTMACSRDVTARMKAAALATNKLGTPATYFEMPNCTHGQVADAENVFGRTFDWLSANERPLRVAGPPT